MLKHANWRCLPGNYDEFHLEEYHFKSSNPAGVPDLLPQDFELPSDITFSGYRLKRLEKIDDQQDICHCFLDDYKLSSIFGYPHKSLEHAKRYYAICTPNFTLSRDYPSVINTYNTFRTRWIGRFWQEHGIRVIPTVSWAGLSSHAYCFAGIPKEQIVALAVPDEVETIQDIRMFGDGYYEMERALKPAMVLVHGDLQRVHVTPSVPVTAIPKWRKSGPRQQAASADG